MDDYTDALCAHLAETAPFAAGHTGGYRVLRRRHSQLSGRTSGWCKILKVILKSIIKVDQRRRRSPWRPIPDSAGDWKALRALRRCGFNRISLGMQSA